MCKKSCLISLLSVFGFIFLFEFLVHGVLLKGIYEQTVDVWRPEGEQNMLFIFLSQLIYAMVIAFIFKNKYDGSGIGDGVRMGLCLGLLVGSIQIGTYCYLPIPLSLPIAWLIAEIIKGVGSGVILSITNKKCDA